MTICPSNELKQQLTDIGDFKISEYGVSRKSKFDKQEVRCKERRVNPPIGNMKRKLITQEKVL